MDEASRPRDDDRPPERDEGEAVFFDEAPAGRTGTSPDDPAPDDGDALLADEAPAGADEADAELAPDAAAGADLLDRAVVDRDGEPADEPAPARPAPPPAGAAPPAVLAAARALLHTAPRHAVGEERASAAVPAADLAPTFTRRPAPPPGAQVAGQAVCPACGARSGWEARVCGRCGADIPPPIPTRAGPLEVGAGAPVPLGLPRQQAAEAPPEGDPADLLPPDVRERVLEARARNARRTVEITADAARREQLLHAGLGALALCGGLVLSGLFDLSTWLTAGFAALDLALGLGLARWMWRTDVTPIHGMLALPAAALVSFACRSGFVPMHVTVSAAPALFFLLAFASGVGRTVATVLADRPSERGF